MLNSFKQPHAAHKCQIDCTNHDEVINKLQLKSKDLYYFWRNYEWLYNRYYSEANNKNQKQISNSRQPQQHPQMQSQAAEANHDKCRLNMHQLEDELAKEKSENRRLKVDNEALKKQISMRSTTGLEEEYRKEKQRLASKCQEYENIWEKMGQENNKLKSNLRQMQDRLEDSHTKHRRQLKLETNKCLQLQQNIDKLRLSLATTSQTKSEMMQTKTTQITAMMNLQRKASLIVEEQMEGIRRQIQEQLNAIVVNFTVRDMQQLLIDDFGDDQV